MPQDLLQMYRWMVVTRDFEQRVCDMWGQPDVVEMQHACIGQEAITIGAVYGLRPDDPIMPSLRGRGAFLVRGVPEAVQMAGIFAKATGPGRGKTSAHHMGDPIHHILPGSGVVGASIAVAVGAALGVKLEKSDRVVVDFFGDGAAQRGDFHEGLNLAGVLRLPIVFVCENNGYASYTPVSRHMAGESFAVRARGYGFPGAIIDGCDVVSVYEAVQEAVQRARAGFGPTLLEAVTHRWRGHCERERPENYRVPGELDTLEGVDPIRRLAEQLRAQGILTDSREREIAQEARARVDNAVKFAQESPFPDPSEASTNVYAPTHPSVMVAMEDLLK